MRSGPEPEVRRADRYVASVRGSGAILATRSGTRNPWGNLAAHRRLAFLLHFTGMRQLIRSRTSYAASGAGNATSVNFVTRRLTWAMLFVGGADFCPVGCSRIPLGCIIFLLLLAYTHGAVGCEIAATMACVFGPSLILRGKKNDTGLGFAVGDTLDAGRRRPRAGPGVL